MHLERHLRAGGVSLFGETEQPHGAVRPTELIWAHRILRTSDQLEAEVRAELGWQATLDLLLTLADMC